jgi:hypothetical protein
MDAKSLTQFAIDPAAFRDALILPSTHGSKRLGAILADFQKRDFAALDKAFLALRNGQQPVPNRFWLERTKGASKDTDLAVMLLWLLAFANLPLVCQVGAADKDQADELRKACKGILRVNPWLAEAIEVQASAILGLRNEARCDILTSDAPSSHGSRPNLVILNELSHVSSREFAETLLDNAEKVPSGLVVIATNAGFDPSWQYEWRETARKSPRWYFANFSEPAPWIDTASLEERRRMSSAERYARLWQGQWVSGSGDALSRDDILAAVNLEGPMTGAVQGFVFVAGLDIGLVKDASALVVVGIGTGHCMLTADDFIYTPGTGRMRLAWVDLWRPSHGTRVDLTQVEDAILNVHQRFRLARLAVDPYQADLLITRLGKAFVPVEPVPFVPTSLQGMATATLESFTGRQIDLYHHEQLITDLQALRLEEKGYGTRLASPRGPSGHGDCATALALALHAARPYRNYRPPIVEGPLICSGPMPEPLTGSQVAAGPVSQPRPDPKIVPGQPMEPSRQQQMEAEYWRNFWRSLDEEDEWNERTGFGNPWNIW